MKKVVAITGGIASGKSTVSRILEGFGAEVHSADEDARAVLELGSPTLEAVRTAFPATFQMDGVLDRRRLGSLIFADPEARLRLNSIMHPAIRARMRTVIDHARATPDPGVLLYEVPLLYEGGLETWFDTVIAVLATPALQSERLQGREAATGRPALTDSALAERLSAQMPPEEKARRADYVVRTDVPLAETEVQARAVWRALTEERGS